jgi:hypothetical protein
LGGGVGMGKYGDKFKYRQYRFKKPETSAAIK